MRIAVGLEDFADITNDLRARAAPEVPATCWRRCASRTRSASAIVGARNCDAVVAVQAAPQSCRDGLTIPGRPPKPQLVNPRDVPHRGLGTPEGRAALVHAVAHIEFNAINLALDAAWRFGGLPDDYYADWISVAQDEARHFQMLPRALARARLRLRRLHRPQRLVGSRRENRATTRSRAWRWCRACWKRAGST